MRHPGEMPSLIKDYMRSRLRGFCGWRGLQGLLGLRLAAPGRVGFGDVWCCRVPPLPVGLKMDGLLIEDEGDVFSGSSASARPESKEMEVMKASLKVMVATSSVVPQ